MKQVPGPEIDSKRKHDIVIFKKCGLSITIHMNLYVANVLDLQFNLQNNVIDLMRNQINVQSNYPFQILKTLPNNIGKKNNIGLQTINLEQKRYEKIQLIKN